MRPPDSLLDLGHRVVVDGGAEHLELRIDDVVEPLTAEADDVRVDDLRVDAERVHHREARRRPSYAAGMDVVDAESA